MPDNEGPSWNDSRDQSATITDAKARLPASGVGNASRKMPAALRYRNPGAGPNDPEESPVPSRPRRAERPEGAGTATASRAPPLHRPGPRVAVDGWSRSRPR